MKIFKLNIKYIFLIFALVLCPHTTFAQYWELIPDSPDSVCRMACDANRNLWVTTHNGDVYLYNGTIWQPKGNVERSTWLQFGNAITVAPNGDIYVSGNHSIYRSTNGGTTWDTVFTAPFSLIEEIVFSNSGEVYFASYHSVYVPDRNNSSSWRKAEADNNGVFGSIRCPIALAPNGTLYAMERISIDEYYIIRSTDAGNSWLRISIGLPYVTALTVIDNNTIFATTRDNRIFKSINGRQGWIEFKPIIPERTIVFSNIIYNSKTGMIFADLDGYDHTTCNVLISTDFGESWEVRNDGLPDTAGLDAYCFAFNPITGETYLRVVSDDYSASIWAGRVYRYVAPVRVAIKDNYRVKPNETIKISVDALDDLSVSGKDVKDFSFILRYNKRILSYKDFTGGTLLSNSFSISVGSSVYGELIVNVTNTTGEPLTGAGSLIDFDFFGLGGDSCGTHLILESFEFNSDGPNSITENGYCELFGRCGGEDIYVTIEQNAFLFQNNPNPIREGYETTIQYRINVAGETNLTVYDVLGREVAKLVNEYKPEGIYSVNFNTKGLSSGVYFYKLRAPRYEAQKKMLIVR